MRGSVRWDTAAHEHGHIPWAVSLAVSATATERLTQSTAESMPVLERHGTWQHGARYSQGLTPLRQSRCVCYDAIVGHSSAGQRRTSRTRGCSPPVTDDGHSCWVVILRDDRRLIVSCAAMRLRPNRLADNQRIQENYRWPERMLSARSGYGSHAEVRALAPASPNPLPWAPPRRVHDGYHHPRLAAFAR